VNWVDLWGLDGVIVIWDALDRADSLNNIVYNDKVDHSYSEIIKAAEEKGLSVLVITGQDATSERLISEIENANNTTTQRLIANAHGDNNGNIYDVRNKQVDITGVQAASSIKIIDVIACNANKNIASWQATGIQDVRTYNPLGPSGEIWWNQTNDATQKRIVESIRSGADTSGPPTVAPVPVTSYLLGSGSESRSVISNMEGQNNVKKNK
jgi:hypothetical protein